MRGGENATNGPTNCRSIISSDTWNISFFTYKPSNVSTYFIHGTARTRVTRIFQSGIQIQISVNCRLFLSILTFGSVRLSILVEMSIFSYLTNSWFQFGLRLCRLADHSLNVTFPSHCLSSPFFKMELHSTKFRK